MSDQVEAIMASIRRLLAERRPAWPDAGGVLIGLLGRAIQSSRSPAMHEREAGRLGLPCAYLLIDFDALGLGDDALLPAIEAARRLGFRGLNVTHPFKQRVVPLLSDLSAEAAAIGAVNTIVFSGAGATGHNTDCWGFSESFREGMGGAALDRVVVLGAGGAGSAVAQALIGLGASALTLIDTDAGRAEALAGRMRDVSGREVTAGTDPERALAGADGLVNTTPVGMAKYPGLPVPAALLRPEIWVADIVYFPPETELLREARRRGCRVLAGTGMAIGQAARAFELFTGRAADRAAMASHFEAAA